MLGFPHHPHGLASQHANAQHVFDPFEMKFVAHIVCLWHCSAVLLLKAAFTLSP
jgi:hypothetical protein